MIKGHGGNIHELAARLNCDVHDIIDASSNLNPLGPPPGLLAYLSERMDSITALPEVDASRLTTLLGRQMDLDPGRILAANGTTQFIYALPRVLGLRSALIVGPTYADYADACALAGCPYAYEISTADTHFQHDPCRLTNLSKKHSAVFICNPNNPTGTLISSEKLADLCRACPDTLFIIDESYLPFHENSETESCIPLCLPNVINLHSMSKIYRIPGLRIGFLIADPSIVEKIRPHVMPWSVNTLACAAAEFLFSNENAMKSFIHTSIAYIQAASNWFQKEFAGIPQILLFPGAGPFILARLSPPRTAEAVCRKLAEDRLLIRNCTNFYGLTNHDIRFSFKSENQNSMLAQRLMRLIRE